MCVHNLESFWCCYGDMVIAHTNDVTIFPVGVVNPGVFLTLSCAQGQPNITELGDKRSRKLSEFLVLGEIRDHPVQNNQNGPEQRKKE